MYTDKYQRPHKTTELGGAGRERGVGNKYGQRAAAHRAHRAAMFRQALQMFQDPTSEGMAMNAERTVQVQPLWSGPARGLIPIFGPSTPADETASTATEEPGFIERTRRAFLDNIKGFDQTSPSEYENTSQSRIWGLATCSAAALTAVLRAAGQPVRIADVMKEMPKAITPRSGLVSRPALVAAANTFGGQANDDVRTYEQLKEATESGQPVLVDFTNAKFREGHWIVVTGVTQDGVQVADSSRYNMTFMSKADFLNSWSRKGIRLAGFTPQSTA